MENANTALERDDGNATMRDIADALNISLATVSRALRRVHGINPETRARVMQTAAQLGYRMAKSYRNESLRGSKLHQVGVLINTPFTQVPAPYLTGMSDAAMTLNAALVVHYVRPETCDKILSPEFQPPALRANLLSGLILVFRWPMDVVQKLSRQIPTVSIVHKYSGLDVDMVGIDNEDGIEELVTHLHGLGHRKIGFFGRCNEVYWGKSRFGAYIAAIEGVGISYKSQWAVNVDYVDLSDYRLSWDRYCEQAERITRQEGVSAWISVTEPAGGRLYAWLTAHNLRVPEDVSVTGFHKPDDAHFSERPLTSVTASYEAIGAAALKRLLYRIQNPAETTRTILFPCELYPGETTSVPPNHH